jgi:hypothetical protein
MEVLAMSSEVLSRDTLAGHRGAVWDYISPSRLSLWIRCPLAFKFRYVDGIRTPPSENLFLGKQVHDGLEYFYRHRQAGVCLSAAEVAGHIDQHWSTAADQEGIEFKKQDASEKLKAKCQSLVACYWDKFADTDEKVIGVEAAMQAALVDPLTGDRLGLPMVGVSDLLLETDDGPVLVDFKTAARGGEPIEQQHEIQLACYASMFRELTGDLEHGLEIRSLVKTKTPRVDVHRYERRSQRHMARLFAVIREYLRAIDLGEFHYRPGFNCMFCDVRQPCIEWDAGGNQAAAF